MGQAAPLRAGGSREEAETIRGCSLFSFVRGTRARAEGKQHAGGCCLGMALHRLTRCTTRGSLGRLRASSQQETMNQRRFRRQELVGETGLQKMRAVIRSLLAST